MEKRFVILFALAVSVSSLSWCTENSQGVLTIDMGPMFSGKSTKAVKLLQSLENAKVKAQGFKHCWDDRYAKNEIIAHTGEKYPACPIKTADDLLKNLKDDTRHIVLDETQFFPTKSMVACIETLLKKGINVTVLGLDLDFRGLKWPTMATLAKKAKEVTLLRAICYKCKGLATKTQRLVNGKPADPFDPTVVIGSQELYQPSCEGCFKISKRRLKKYVRLNSSKTNQQK